MIADTKTNTTKVGKSLFFSAIEKINGVERNSLSTHKKRRFLNFLRSLDYQNDNVSIYLKVYYGISLSACKKLERFYNDCSYQYEAENPESLEHDIWQAFYAFTEKGLWDDE